MTRSFRLLLMLAVPAIIAGVASTAYGHARLMNPAPRDNQDGYKDPPRAPPGTGAPCGISEAASQPHTTLTPGAAINVAWEETVDHPGCFVVDFSPANDANFQTLARKSHANPPARTGTPATRKYTMSVTLPTTPCPKCTLRLRQLMLAADVAEASLATGCPPNPIPAGATYYSCANIVLGGGGSGGGGTSGAGGTTGSGGRGGTSGQAGTTGQGQAGTTGQGQAGTTGQGQAGTTGQGQAGTTGQAQAGTTGQAQAGTTGSSGAAGTSGGGQAGTSGGGGGEATGGCRVAGGAPAPLALLLALALLRRARRRSRS